MLPRARRHNNLRAILIPASESAEYSVRLQENNVYHPVRDALPLPSPYSSSSEDEDTTTLSKNPTNANRTKYRRERVAIFLEQKDDKESFTLGASASNDAVLKHRQPADEKYCYINLVHTRLYPDPDHDRLAVYNCSTSAFRASRTAPPINKTIPPSNEAGLDAGSWTLELGEGLAFHVVVVPRALVEKSALAEKLSSRLIISPRSTGHAGTTSPAPPSLPRTKFVAPPVLDTIGETSRTLVFKGERSGAVVAIKVFRKPTLKESADTWRNETMIMKYLGTHVSKNRRNIFEYC